jgi:hypothetical protein
MRIVAALDGNAAARGGDRSRQIAEKPQGGRGAPPMPGLHAQAMLLLAKSEPSTRRDTP